MLPNIMPNTCYLISVPLTHPLRFVGSYRSKTFKTNPYGNLYNVARNSCPQCPQARTTKSLPSTIILYMRLGICTYVIRGPLKYNRKSFNHPNQHENHHPRTQSKAHQPDLPSRRCRRHQLDTGFLRKARVECKGCARLELIRRNL